MSINETSYVKFNVSEKNIKIMADVTAHTSYSITSDCVDDNDILIVGPIRNKNVVHIHSPDIFHLSKTNTNIYM